ncbi:hypothetical protein, partial [Neobacillus jeddahensis]|uniref:hypothetical protein n=1 Tax=Neobacillus jeddahensis TaxID=1461580 RepID=UPI0005A7A91E
MEHLLKTLKIALEEVGRNITIDKLSIHSLLFDEELYGLIDTNPEGNSLDDVIWLKFNKEVFLGFFKEEMFEEIKKILTENKGVYFAQNGAFFKHICVEGVSRKFKINLAKESINVMGIEIQKITNASIGDWRKGFFAIESETGENFYQISEKLKNKITKALEPYINEPCFAYLRRQLINQFSRKVDQELFLTECEKCNKQELYHVIEIVNQICNPDFCRTCAESKFPSISKVPFGIPFLVNLYGYFNNLFQDFLHKRQEPPNELLNEILPFITSVHPLEMGVVSDYVRSKVKKHLEKDSYALMEVLNEIVEGAKKTNMAEYKKLITNLEKMSSYQSLQTTTDMVETYKNIEEKSMNSFMQLFYP